MHRTHQITQSNRNKKSAQSPIWLCDLTSSFVAQPCIPCRLILQNMALTEKTMQMNLLELRIKRLCFNFWLHSNQNMKEHHHVWSLIESHIVFHRIVSCMFNILDTKMCARTLVQQIPGANTEYTGAADSRWYYIFEMRP